MGGISHNCKGNRRCRICGKPDYCNWVEFPDSGDILEYCHRVSGSKGDTVQGVGGGTFICRRTTSEGFTVWEPLEEYQRNLEEFKRLHPREGKSGTWQQGQARFQPVTRQAVDLITHRDDEPVEGCSELLPPERLDLFYRTFLSLLVLEKKHEQILRKEWDATDGLFEKILNTWTIKSVPPEDYLRFSTKERLENPSRKKIMEALIEKCGEPKGVPGFYRRKDGNWTFYQLCGIAYPIFNTHGQIIRIRIADDYPEVLSEDPEEPGIYRYEKGEAGTGWYFIPEENGRYLYKASALVFNGEDVKEIALGPKGYPPGKVRGKYKNFSSYQEKREKQPDGTERLVNRLNEGCQSGSRCSLYARPNDSLSVVYATEGEKKAIVANALLNVPTISIPGTSSFSKLFTPEEGYETSMMDELTRRGMQMVVLVYDADKNQNAMVLTAEAAAVKRFRDNGLRIAIGAWNPAWGKGLDDVLLTGVVPQITMVQ